MTSTNASIFASSTQPCLPVSPTISNKLASPCLNVSSPRSYLVKKKHVKWEKRAWKLNNE
ncbi:hypothetical protein JHK82_015674 [Glycine max]|nr:hypothetical protein JHK82_015674 [Glycine max]